jgi:hypothetical protein
VNDEPATAGYTTLWGTTAVLLFTIVVTLFALARVGRRVRIYGSAWFYLAFGVVYVVATASTGSGSNAVRAVLTVVASLFFLVAVSEMNADQRRTADGWVIGLAIVQASIAIWQKLFNEPILWGYLGTVPEATHAVNPIWEPGGRAMGSLSHPIPLALIIGVGIILILSRARVRLLWRIAICGVLLAGLFASGTRSGVISVAVVGAVALLSSFRGRTRWFWRVVVVGGLVAASSQLSLFGANIIASLIGTQSLEHRGTASDVAANLLNAGGINLWFGYGREGLDFLAQRGIIVSDVVLAIDNNFVTLLAVSGLVGLAAIIGLLLYGFSKGDTTSRLGLILVVSMFLSFDVSLWFPCTLVLLYFAGSHTRSDLRI